MRDKRERMLGSLASTSTEHWPSQIRSHDPHLCAARDYLLIHYELWRREESQYQGRAGQIPTLQKSPLTTPIFDMLLSWAYSMSRHKVRSPGVTNLFLPHTF